MKHEPPSNKSITHAGYLAATHRKKYRLSLNAPIKLRQAFLGKQPLIGLNRSKLASQTHLTRECLA